MGGGGRGHPRGSENNFVKAGGRPVPGPPCTASRCLRGGTPTASAASARGHRTSPATQAALETRGAVGVPRGCGSEKPSLESALFRWDPPPGSNGPARPALGEGQGAGLGRQASGPRGTRGLRAFGGLPGPAGPRRSHAVVRRVFGGGWSGGVNRPRLSSPGPRLAAPFCLCSLAISVFPVRCP